MTKALRVSIQAHHHIYVQSIASQMGCDSNQAINYLLWELRRTNWQFGQQMPSYTAPMKSTINEVTALHLQNTFDSSYDQPTAMSGLSFIPEEMQEEVDPIIQKFISLGLVDQF